MATPSQPGQSTQCDTVTVSRYERDTMIIDDKFFHVWSISMPSESLLGASAGELNYSSPLPRGSRIWGFYVRPYYKTTTAGWSQQYRPSFQIGVSLPKAKLGTRVQMRCSIVDGQGKKMYTTKPEVGVVSEEEKKLSVTGSFSKCDKVSSGADVVFLFEVEVYRPPDPRFYESSIMGKQLSSARKEKLFTDFTLVVDGQEFQVHKLILATRSPVFRKMIESPMKESQEGRVTINDFTAEVVEEMLTFIYSSEAPRVAEMVMDLLAIADKYQLDDLKKACGKELDRRLTIDNAVKTLVIADTYNVVPLKMACGKFIAVHLSEIEGTPGWATVAEERQDAYLRVVEALAHIDISPSPAKKA